MLLRIGVGCVGGLGLLPLKAAADEGEAGRARTSETMIEEVGAAWRRAETSAPVRSAPTEPETPLEAKLDRIRVPALNLAAMPLDRVATLLGALAYELDDGAGAERGVNIVWANPGEEHPAVTLSLRDLPLRRVLDLVAEASGCSYEVQADAVVLRRGGAPAALSTRFFAVARPAVLRMTSRGGAAPEAGGAVIREFLQQAGVDFAGVPGSTLAFDGSQLIVTQTSGNLARIGRILARYRELRQVEIEAKFMEVQQGVLEELGVQWDLAARSPRSGRVRATAGTGGVNRTLQQAFSFQSGAQSMRITAPGDEAGSGTDLELPVTPPSIPGAVGLGAADATLAQVAGIVGDTDVAAMIRALAQRSGTELLSAPKLTVLSGNLATITIAQEFRYPQSYGQIQSQVGTGNTQGGGSAGVSITSGTPQDFATRNVGVELRVTPTVEEDGQSICLELHPKVTEFEGFVEYGGPSIAISGGTTVTVPPGFYQPIFAVREVTTRVTLWDGATLVMGGLTREDVKKVSDKVPVLGSLPLIGRLFRSTAESAQKRNLLIFVTARLVSPGGGPAREPEPG
ncbi:MAG: hypothetical protein JNG83_00135 [Opitutaceae bacterium]|nr:hypothetical protein [Opitutaceae bacterium]